MLRGVWELEVVGGKGTEDWAADVVGKVGKGAAVEAEGREKGLTCWGS